MYESSYWGFYISFDVIFSSLGNDDDHGKSLSNGSLLILDIRYEGNIYHSWVGKNIIPFILNIFEKMSFFSLSIFRIVISNEGFELLQLIYGWF